MRVLIVDDNQQMREMLELWLSDLAAEIEQCDDGAKALSAYAGFLPDWVLMDWEMKEMDGLTATKQIVANFPDARVVMVTMHDKTELREAARNAGICSFISKENLFDLRELMLSHNRIIFG